MTKKVNFMTDEKYIPKKSIKRSKTPGRTSKEKYYTQKKAREVGKRIHFEAVNMKVLEKRLKDELFVEKLLIKNNFYSKINKIYRLSNDTLYVLKVKLYKSPIKK